MNAEKLVDLLDDYLEAREHLADLEYESSGNGDRSRCRLELEQARSALVGAISELLREGRP